MDEVQLANHAASQLSALLTGSSQERWLAACGIFDLAHMYGDLTPAVAGALTVAYRAEGDAKVRSQIIDALHELIYKGAPIPRSVVLPILRLAETDVDPGDYELVESIAEAIEDNERAERSEPTAQTEIFE